jgi:hypothetical protein
MDKGRILPGYFADLGILRSNSLKCRHAGRETTPQNAQAALSHNAAPAVDPAVESLKAELNLLRQEVASKKLEALENEIAGLQTRIAQLQQSPVGRTEMDILDRGLSLVQGELSGLRLNVRFAAGQGLLPGVQGMPPQPPKTPEQRESRRADWKAKLENYDRIEKLGTKLFGPLLDSQPNQAPVPAISQSPFRMVDTPNYNLH